MTRLIVDETARDAICRAGFNPDDPESLGQALASPENASTSHWILLEVAYDAHEFDVPRAWESALLRHVYEDGPGSLERQIAALELLERLLQSEVLPICRAALANPLFFHKPSAVSGIARYGTTSDVKRVRDWIKTTVPRRSRRYRGGNPIDEGAAFIHRMDLLAAEELRRWLTVRWYSVIADFNPPAPDDVDEHVRWYVPNFSAAPHSVAIAGSGESEEAIAKLIEKYFPDVRVCILERIADDTPERARIVIAVEGKTASQSRRDAAGLNQPVPVLELRSNRSKFPASQPDPHRIARKLADAFRVVGLL